MWALSLVIVDMCAVLVLDNVGPRSFRLIGPRVPFVATKRMATHIGLSAIGVAVKNCVELATFVDPDKPIFALCIFGMPDVVERK